jgi:hypothetical protein
VLRSRNRVTLDAQRFAQLASWKGQIVIDGEEIAPTAAAALGAQLSEICGVAERGLTPNKIGGLFPKRHTTPACTKTASATTDRCRRDREN